MHAFTVAPDSDEDPVNDVDEDTSETMSTLMHDPVHTADSNSNGVTVAGGNSTNMDAQLPSLSASSACCPRAPNCGGAGPSPAAVAPATVKTQPCCRIVEFCCGDDSYREPSTAWCGSHPIDH